MLMQTVRGSRTRASGFGIEWRALTQGIVEGYTMSP